VGILALIFQKVIIIIGSSYVGAYILFYGIDIFAQSKMIVFFNCFNFFSCQPVSTRPLKRSSVAATLVAKSTATRTSVS